MESHGQVVRIMTALRNSCIVRLFNELTERRRNGERGKEKKVLYKKTANAKRDSIHGAHTCDLMDRAFWSTKQRAYKTSFHATHSRCNLCSFVMPAGSLVLPVRLVTALEEGRRRRGGGGCHAGDGLS